MPLLNLKTLESWQIPMAHEAFHARNGAGFASAGYSNGTALALVFDNVRALKSKGIYERALLSAFVGCKGNHSHWTLDPIRYLFEAADAAALRKCGSPIPVAPITAYRGISGQGRRRRIRSLSWTMSLEVACWFALRYEHLKNPAVYSTTFTPNQILAVVEDRGEQEVIGLPEKIERVRMPPDEMEKLAKIHTEAIRKRDVSALKRKVV